MNRTLPKLTITPKGERALKGGHPWVYGDEVTSAEAYENGDIVDVYSAKGRWLGSGFVNDHSKIRVRIISRNANDRFDEPFWKRRVGYAIDYRKTVMQGDDFKCCRLIFGEADTFPGLTVDRFDNVLVAQTLSLGIELRKEIIFSALVQALRERGEQIDVLYERNDQAIRELEGMKQYTGYWMGEGLSENSDGKVIIKENGIEYEVDYVNGQKTGFFLDQKYNRQAVARLAKGKTVLDCFTHTGAFALNAAKAGANHVTAVDVSASAIELTQHNAERNGLTESMSFLTADVFDLLTEMSKEGHCPYDFIILDPPAFTKSRSTIKDAYRGYKEINLKAMKLLPRGGYLATCSCSHFMSDELFRKMLNDAANDASVSLRQIEARQQSPDHPILWNVPETDYLKILSFPSRLKKMEYFSKNRSPVPLNGQAICYNAVTKGNRSYAAKRQEVKKMKNARSTVTVHSEGYEIVARREDCAADFYRFFYGEPEEEKEEIFEGNLTNAEHTDFLKSACLLFVAALATVVLLLVI